MVDIIETTHVLDSTGELCEECGLFEDFFIEIPDCPAMNESGEEGEESEEDEDESEEKDKEEETIP